MDRKLGACFVITFLSLLCLRGDEAAAEFELRFRQISTRIFSSSEPTGQGVYRNLAEQGFSVVISVDGKHPRVGDAHAAGLRYFHLPIGYDGVPVETQVALKRILEEAKGKVLVHCHHGKHRGPASAVIAAMIEGELSPERALEILHRSGTGAQYQGLWGVVRNFDIRKVRGASAPLVSSAQVDPFVEEMIRMDGIMEKLKERSKENGSSADSYRNLLVLLEEAYRESLRMGELAELEPGMLNSLNESLDRTSRLRAAIGQSPPESFPRELTRLKRDCVSCHRKFRN